MIHFVSHFEGIKGRDAKHLLSLLAPVIKWNFECISSIPGVSYSIIANEASEELLEEISPGLTINRSTLTSNIEDEIQSLSDAYNKINMANRVNYGLDFEYKCFERFLLIDALASNVNADYFVHVDCDLALSANAISKYINAFTKFNKETIDSTLILAPNDYSTYLCGFSRTSLRNFCGYIYNSYLNESHLAGENYRVSDMGALKSALSHKCLHRRTPFGDFDQSHLTSDLMSFQPLSSFLAGNKLNLPSDQSSIRWWRLDDVSELEIEEVANCPSFFKFSKNGFTIERNGTDAYFTHFHGRTKLFIKYLL